MTITLTTSGTQTATIGTEHIIFSDTTSSKYFHGYIDLSNMVSGDITEIRVYTIIKSSGSFILYQLTTFTDVQTTPLVYIPAIPTDLGLKITIKQTLGTGRNYDYRIYEI